MSEALDLFLKYQRLHGVVDRCSENSIFVFQNTKDAEIKVGVAVIHDPELNPKFIPCVHAWVCIAGKPHECTTQYLNKVVKYLDIDTAKNGFLKKMCKREHQKQALETYEILHASVARA